MIIPRENLQEYIKGKETPHRWFAWHPVKVKNAYIWLQYVWRKAHEASWDGHGGIIWMYSLDKKEWVKWWME